jgi:alkanesulfonate monooxygenase SsuD/methylene tetrahydromethanopterin reductase-like flavin-dependent oxidoreductase (luciferase family)
MMERFWEAHDLIVKAWTTHDGPFNWEGKYFHHRQVNIWPRPYQEPHPPVWITALSPGSARDVGEKGYVVACFLTGWDGTRGIFGAYRARRAELGLPAPALDRFAYAALVYTGETDEEGYAGARKLMWYIESNKVPPQFTGPPGYHPIASAVGAMKAATLRGQSGHRLPRDQEDVRARRGLRPPAHHGPGRVPGPRRDGQGHADVQPGSLSAAQGARRGRGGVRTGGGGRAFARRSRR